MRAMRKRVRDHDVARWAGDFLRVLEKSAAANAHQLEDPAGDDDLPAPVDVPDLGPMDGVSARDTSGSAQAPRMAVDVELTGNDPTGYLEQAQR